MARPIVFFGSSPFSVPVLSKLISSEMTIPLVITFPDHPSGRHLAISSNPVKSIATRLGLSVIENPSDLKNTTLPADCVGLVAAYGKIIKPEIMSIFHDQIYNIHPSMLPKYRGPSPLQFQILDGISESGVSLIRIDNEPDHGPIIARLTSPVLNEDTTQTLGKRLFALGTELFLDFLSHPENFPEQSQHDSAATYTSFLTRQDGFISFEFFKKALDDDYRITVNMAGEPVTIEQVFRALHPWPGVWTSTPSGKRLKLVSLNPHYVQLEGKTPRLWPL
jgi:methionyl-tRNA formyltransferase